MDRLHKIAELVRGKDVLDIGSTGDAAGNDALFRTILAEAKNVTGIDILPSPHRHVVQGNMENYGFRKKFDVIVAGDVLEHIDNQGLFLANIRRHLRKDGLLFLSTPNAKWWTIIYRPHTTHVLWHDQYTLRLLLERAGFSIRELGFYHGNWTRAGFWNRLFYRRRQICVVCGIRDGVRAPGR